VILDRGGYRGRSGGYTQPRRFERKKLVENFKLGLSDFAVKHRSDQLFGHVEGGGDVALRLAGGVKL
jgi:hypothetical protein